MNTPKPTTTLGENLGGAIDMMMGRDEGLKRIDISSSGFWVSFYGLGLTGLIDAAALSSRYASHAVSNLADPPTKLWFVVGSLIIGTIAYLASMLMLYLLCRDEAERLRFPSAVIAHNWAAPIVSIAVLPLIFLSVANPSDSSNPTSGTFWTLITIVFIAVLCLIGTRLIRISLGISGARALLFFAVTTLVSLVTVEGFEALLGFAEQT